MRAVKNNLPTPSGEVGELEGPRWTRAVEDQSAPIPEETTSELGRIIFWITRCGIAWDKARCSAFNDSTWQPAKRNHVLISSQAQTAEQLEPDVRVIADETNDGWEVEVKTEAMGVNSSRSKNLYKKRGKV